MNPKVFRIIRLIGLLASTAVITWLYFSDRALLMENRFTVIALVIGFILLMVILEALCRKKSD
jgi:hypothetical protein